MKVKTFSLGPLETNCYVASQDGAAVIIDPGGDPAKVLDYLGAEKLAVERILNTHFHFDHIAGNRKLADAVDAPVYASPKDANLLETELGAGGFMGFPEIDQFRYEALDEGEYTLLGQPMVAIATPGHSQGSMSFHFPQAGCVFVGDLIFQRSVGRTDFPGGDHAVLIESVREKIFTLPDDTVLYPGHGPSTTISDEKLHNPFFSEF
jgi:glyoxylase-like metal-dependent hydrolase (beta-lactamase superfamily II)